MQSSQVPDKSPLVFAQNAAGGYVRAIPQTTADPFMASYDIGFPPDTFVDEDAGGKPPDGRDFNGAFRALDAWRRWFAAGGSVAYDITFQTAIGGYPLGAIVTSAATNGLQWLSMTENNITNPDIGGAGWVPFLGRRATLAEIQTGTEDFKVVTPKGLKDAGGLFVTDSNLNANNGYRVYSDGFKECWGTVSVPGNGTLLVALPVDHTSWFNVALGVTVRSNSQDNTGISVKTGVASFTLRNSEAGAIPVDWNTRGF